MRLRNVLLAAFLPLVVSGGGDRGLASVDNIEWNDDRWEIIVSDFMPLHYQSRMSLANGYLGINLASIGPFFEVDHPIYGDNYNGWPLFNTRQTFATVAGFYDADDRDGGHNYPWLMQYGGDSFLSGIPHWAGLLVEANGAVLNASTNSTHIQRFTTRLDMKGGILQWAFDWTPGGDQSTLVNIEYEILVHKLYVNQGAVQLRLKSSRDVSVRIYDVIDGSSAVRSDFVGKSYVKENPTIWSAVSPKNATNVTAYVVSTLKCDEYGIMSTRSEIDDHVFRDVHEASIGQSIQFDLLGGKRVEVTKYVGVASSDAFHNPYETALKASFAGASTGFFELRHSHVAEWEAIMTQDSVDRYTYPNGTLPEDSLIRELHITSVTNPFMILQNTVGPNAIAAADMNPRLNIHSIPVCGLASDCYGGLVFWDAETWMALGLQLSHPLHIQNVVNYRVEMYPQAKENIKTAFASSKNQTGRFTGGAVYPWTSGRYGNCTASGPCFDYEYHVNGDIGMTLRNQFIVTGDAWRFNETYLPISNDIAYFYGEVVDFNETSGYYELWNATDPDEYANNVNNVGFTTALIQRHLNETNEFNTMFDRPQNETWNKISAQMRLPVHEEAGIVMEYSTMNGSLVVKQADVVLIDDILNYENPYSLVDLDYYANKQSPDGPGMTYATFSIVANEISPSGCSSYTYHHYSSQPYARAPWFQYSEQMIDMWVLNGGTHPAFPFLTGMGGTNRIGIFGYLGLRMFPDRLDIDPSIPPQIPHLDFRTFFWQGYGINATANTTHTTLMRLPKKVLATANPEFYDSIPITLGTRPGSFNLRPYEMLVIPNRMLGQTLTAAGNILQCKPVVTNRHQSNLPGQFPIAAIDGASSTKWQPENSTRINYLTVDTEATTFGPIHRVLFDWGCQPPTYFEVLVSNTSVPPFEDIILEAGKGYMEEDGGDVRNVTAGLVKVSEPYDPSRATVIEPVRGNQTNVTLVGDEMKWSGRYVHLGIRGNLGNKTTFAGGTVAEWSVILEDREEGRKSWKELLEEKKKDVGYILGWNDPGRDVGGEYGKDGKEGLNMWVQSKWVKDLWRR